MGRREPRGTAQRIVLTTLTVCLLAGVSLTDATAAETGSPTQDASTMKRSDHDMLIEALQTIKSMQQEIRTLKAQVAQQGTVSPAQAPVATLATAGASLQAAQPAAAEHPGSLFELSKSSAGGGMRWGAYGEFKVGSQRNSDAGGKWENGFDAGRLVLLPSYQFTDNITFNSEIEFEHGGAAFDADDKLHGTAEVEQAYVDFKVRDYLNFHSPGVDLVPVGFTNQHHEPTTFYSVNRPELANGLVPTTLQVPSWGTVYGRIADGLGYQFQVSSSLEDFGDDFGTRTDANGVPNGAYTAGIDGKEALGLSKPPVGDFRQLSNSLAYAGQLEYAPPFIPGLAGSTSLYLTPNVEPRGAHADVGGGLGHSSLTLLDSELRYRIPKTGLELRSEYAQAFFGRPANLRANNDGDATNNVGRTMWGISGEAAYHLPLGRVLGGRWEMVPFYRFTYENLQTSGFRGTDENMPTGAGQRRFHTLGVAVFPTESLVLKLDYQHVGNNESGSAKSDSILGGVGFFF